MTSSTPLRRDIEGMRAIAILAVALFHAGLPLHGGYVGVDIFFVISGFLISSLLLREVERTGTISLWSFYARRAKRLLPATFVVLLASLACTWALAPAAQKSTFALDAAFAAGYIANLHFAERAVDYLAEDVGPSPVLHFWSLSVEEQFYFCWPLLILVGVWLARRTNKRIEIGALLILTLVVVPSFVWSLTFSSQKPAAAFFVTSTRLWELGVGAMLALATPLLPLPNRRLSEAAGLLGLLFIGLSLAMFGHGTTWPGVNALLPCTGAALLLFSGSNGTQGFVSRALSHRWLVWIGGLSYSLYLWHWPVLVVGREWLSLSGPSWSTGLVALSVLPAWLSYRFVETPVRFGKAFQRSSRFLVSAGLVSSLFSAVLAVTVARIHAPDTELPAQSAVELSVEPGRVKAFPARLGAGVLKYGSTRQYTPPTQLSTSLAPQPKQATADVPIAYELGCQASDGSESKWCELGNAQGTRRLVALGDSKMLQYYEALDVAGQALDLRVQTVTRSACPFAPVRHPDPVKAKSRRCYENANLVLEQLLADPPDAIITSQVRSVGKPPDADDESEGSRNSAGESQHPLDDENGDDGNNKKWLREAMVDGLRQYWSRLSERGIKVIVLLDNPSPPSKMMPIYSCVLEHSNELGACSFTLDHGRRGGGFPAQWAAARSIPGVAVIDLADLFCPNEICSPVIGDVLVYRQGSHVTNTYARSMAPELSLRLEKALRSH